MERLITLKDATSSRRTMRFQKLMLWTLTASIALTARLLLAKEAGASLNKFYCAICHEATDSEARAPGRAVLRQMTPEHILQVLETGVMKTQAAERSRTQRRILAEYLSEKKFGSVPPDIIPRSAFCGNAVAVSANVAGSAEWNGWGVTITNTRFQPASAAGLTAADVPRLKLKWAFGYPGATTGGTQPVVVGGRLYVGNAEGDIFALDTKTGCIHWNFQADAGVRSAIVIGKTADGRSVAYFGDQSPKMYAVGAAIWNTPAVDLKRRLLYAGTGNNYSVPATPTSDAVVAFDMDSGKIRWVNQVTANDIWNRSCGRPTSATPSRVRMPMRRMWIL